MSYSIESLKSINKCKKRREFQIPKNKFNDTITAQQNFAIESIKKLLLYGIKKEEVEEQSKILFDTLEFVSDETKECCRKDLLFYINRYVDSEKRNLVLAVPASPNIYGLEVNITPDMLYVEDNSIEVIKYMYKKPDMTQTGRKPDHCAYDSMLLYSLLYYGEKLVTPGKNTKVKASIYFLKRNDDKLSKGEFSMDFFDVKNGKHIISIDTMYTNQPGEMSYWDLHYKPKFESFIQGENLSYDEERCKYCELKNVCNYKSSPEAIQESTKNLTDVLKTLQLSSEQRAAINFQSGVAKINAGAGTGKTLTIALRTVGLLRSGFSPDSICLLTFTDSGAREMKERIKAYCEFYMPGKNIEGLIVKTFNSFGNDLIEDHYSALGFHSKPRLIDDVERAAIIAEMLQNTHIKGLDYRNFNTSMKYLKGALAMTQKIFEIIKNNRLEDKAEDHLLILNKLENDSQFVAPEALSELFVLYTKYNAILKERCLLEYADQEIMLLELGKINPMFFNDLKLSHIIVDEFQDSSLRQIEIINKLISTSTFKSLMVVGDDSQSIYSFRDTTPEFIINFDKYIQLPIKDFYLLHNHRSTPKIIDFANKVNANNKNKIKKNLVSVKDNGPDPIVKGFFKKEEEYSFIRNMICLKKNNNIPYEDMAFIGATRSELLAMEKLLNREGIPTILLNPEPDMQNSNIVAAIDFIHFLYDNSYVSGLVTFLNAWSGNKLLQQSKVDVDAVINKYLAFGLQFIQYSDEVKFNITMNFLQKLDCTDELYLQFLEGLESKKSFSNLYEYCMNFLEYGEQSSHKRELKYPGIVLTTAHSSKGLEWNHVFLSISKFDDEELRLPEKADLLEEKRRLFFVAITRAKESLYVTGKYNSFGKLTDENWNIFLEEAYQIFGKNISAEVDTYQKKK